MILVLCLGEFDIVLAEEIGSMVVGGVAVMHVMAVMMAMLLSGETWAVLVMQVAVGVFRVVV